MDTTYYVTIVDKFYTDLNEPIEDITAIDSTTEFTYDSTAWCNNTIVKFDYCYVCNTIGTTIIYNHYGVGLGDVLSGNANSEGSWESRNLIYANKIDTGECGERDDRVLNTYSSIAQSLEIYPNPTSNYLRLTENLDLDKMLCFDQTGKLVSELNSDDEQIDVSHLPNGQYVLLLIKDQIFVSKTFTVVGH